MTAPLTCRTCGSSVSLDRPDKMLIWSPRGARVQCDGCGADLGRLSVVLDYLERKAEASA